MATQAAYNLDCMAYMRALPDKAFDLAVVDPPYGGGGQGFAGPERFGGHFDRYRVSHPDRREVGGEVRKKSLPGTTRQAKSILMSCFAFPSNKSSGAAITFRCRRAAAF